MINMNSINLINKKWDLEDRAQTNYVK